MFLAGEEGHRIHQQVSWCEPPEMLWSISGCPTNIRGLVVRGAVPVCGQQNTGRCQRVCGQQNTGRCQRLFQGHMFFTGWALLEAVQASWGWAVLLKSAFSAPRSPHRLWHPLLKAPEALLSLMDNSFSFFPFVLSHKEKLLLFQGEEGGREGRKEGGKGRRVFFSAWDACTSTLPALSYGLAGSLLVWQRFPAPTKPWKVRGKIIIHLHLADGVQTPRDRGFSEEFMMWMCPGGVFV